MIRFLAVILALAVAGYAIIVWRHQQVVQQDLAAARRVAARCGFPVNWVTTANGQRGDPLGMVALDEHLNFFCATDQQHAVRACMERELKKAGMAYQLPIYLGNCVSPPPVPVRAVP